MEDFFATLGFVACIAAGCGAVVGVIWIASSVSDLLRYGKHNDNRHAAFDKTLTALDTRLKKLEADRG